MKKEFSNHWKSSKQPRKQRKYLAKAPLHKKRKFLSVNLSKELRKKYNKRNIPLRKNDKVKILRGKHKGEQGKIMKIRAKRLKVYIEGIQAKKQDGSKVNVPINSSNLQIIELNLDDKRRMKNLKKEKKEEKKEKIKNETIKERINA